MSEDLNRLEAPLGVDWEIPGQKDDSFGKAIVFVLSREGGWTNNPSDPGGETNLGISRRSYPDEDIRNMTIERASLLYARDYWTPNRCGAMPYEVALPLFDFAVNAPAHQARRCLQRVIGAKADSVLGPRSMALLQSAIGNRGALAIGLDLTDHRLQRYVSRVCSGAASTVFLLGWMRRLHHVIAAIHN